MEDTRAGIDTSGTNNEDPRNFRAQAGEKTGAGNYYLQAFSSLRLSPSDPC